MNPDVEQLKALAETEVDTASRPDPEGSGGSGGRRTGAVSAEQLVALAKDSGLHLFHDQYQEPFAWVVIQDVRQSLKIQGKRFQQWLVRLAWLTMKKAPSRETVQSAMQILAACARFDGPEYPLGTRVMRTAEAIWYDLGHHVVRIMPAGWEVMCEPHPLFLRHTHQRPQVVPVSGGEFRTILKFINLPCSTSGLSSDQLLLLVSVILMVVPDIAHPVLCIHAEQGSGKTTLMRMLRELIDPSATSTIPAPDSVREFVQIASHHYLVFLDNLSTLPEWLSDALCRCVTGEGYSKRELYSDDEDVLYSFRRSIALNGINLVPSKPDLLDRAIIISLDRIPETERCTDAQLWKRFDTLRPQLLGALFTLMSQILVHVGSVTVTKLPRLADFATYGMAAAKALGLREELFLEALRANGRAQTAEALQASPVAQALLVFLEGKSQWTGPPTALLKELNQIADQAGVDQKSRLWPREVRWVWRRIKEVRPNLFTVGWQADQRVASGKSEIAFTRRPSEIDASVHSDPNLPAIDGDQTQDNPTELPDCPPDDPEPKCSDTVDPGDTRDSRIIFPTSTDVDLTGWPIAIPGLGPRELVSYEPCHWCQEGTWQRYGGFPHCKYHALQAFASEGRPKTPDLNSDSRNESSHEQNHEKGDQTRG